MLAESNIDHRRITYSMRVAVEDTAITALEVQVLLDALLMHLNAMEQGLVEDRPSLEMDWRSARCLINMATAKSKDIEQVIDEFCGHDAEIIGRNIGIRSEDKG